ncbi:hypothetical protein ACL02T_09795 [Pseudonocardia sp. RS010]|uniref:hypothetical protein n=1 Tax=Pseudonocardia sp. RS010 TaxID=3385979 RepID=UPI0039A395F4
MLLSRVAAAGQDAHRLVDRCAQDQEGNQDADSGAHSATTRTEDVALNSDEARELLAARVAELR